MAYVKKQRTCPCGAVDSHNRESTKELLSVVRQRIREMKYGESDCTGMVILEEFLTLGGAIKGSLLDEYDIAQFLLAVVNSREAYRRWDNLNEADSFFSGNANTYRSHNKKRQYVSDHTQDFIVKAVRQVLFETISSLKCDLGKEDEFRLIDCQFVSFHEAFKVSTE